MSEADQPIPLSTATVNDAGADRFAPDKATIRRLSREASEGVPLSGYLGEGGSEDSRRLYDNIALERWIEIPTDAIVGRVSAAADGDLTDGPSLVWVHADAILVWCESVRASSFETPAPSGPSLDRAPAGVGWPRPPRWG